MKKKTKPKKAPRNRAQCLLCGDIIESKYRHDFVWCKCKSLAVDGWKMYMRRWYFERLEDFKDLR